jgi:hypothetical protein
VKKSASPNVWMFGRVMVPVEQEDQGRPDEIDGRRRREDDEQSCEKTAVTVLPPRHLVELVADHGSRILTLPPDGYGGRR